MPKRDYTQLRADYIKSKITLTELSRKYGVPFGTIRQVSRRENWAELRKKTQTKTDNILAEKTSKQEAKRIDMFNTIADKLLKQILDGINDGSIVAMGKGYRDVTGALKDLREIKGIKSDIDLQEQLARIEKLRKEATQEDKTQEIKVVIDNDLKDYAN